ncbi:hypothetical protein DFQ14_11930 [Halopolyspora algeriensis]|uniref:Zinc finger protein n=1 Tax=Halopolyspora algeriensis TaxID=1500506 RepID=A0A368VCH4_9ACTN|nr:hypothetical protein [Halopolyspora algeriensis]RCW38826.1 hypothetical protein DFQ14_11930 [Halopolyspora algeriensis]TQM46664.1 hypothetical protein FHU43_3782 [Halopolyspora algeriensis]
MSDNVHRYVPDHERHYWLPIPSPENRRHAFRGGRRWDGRRNGETVCGVTVPMAAPSEMDWVWIPTCGHCWSALLAERDRKPADS